MDGETAWAVVRLVLEVAVIPLVVVIWRLNVAVVQLEQKTHTYQAIEKRVHESEKAEAVLLAHLQHLQADLGKVTEFLTSREEDRRRATPRQDLS